MSCTANNHLKETLLTRFGLPIGKHWERAQIKRIHKAIDATKYKLDKRGDYAVKMYFGENLAYCGWFMYSAKENRIQTVLSEDMSPIAYVVIDFTVQQKRNTSGTLKEQLKPVAESYTNENLFETISKLETENQDLKKKLREERELLKSINKCFWCKIKMLIKNLKDKL